MTLFFNVLFAWIALILGVLLSVIWLIRLIQKKIPKGSNKDFIISINKYLRKKHINMGYIFLILSFFHGMFSSFSIFSFNYGTITLILGVVISYTYIYRVNLGKLWIKYHRQFTILLIVSTLFHILEVGGFVGIDKVVNSIKSDLTQEKQVDFEDNNIINITTTKYKDGVYEGVGNGYRPNLKVQVTVKDGLINEILIVEHNEVGKRFYIPAFEIMPDNIIEKQTPQVDSVSGSTYSSKGIIEAVEDALSSAVQ